MTAIIAAAFAAGACARTATVQSGGEVAPAPQPTTTLPTNTGEVPTGSTLQVKLNETLGTSQNKVGDPFTATVSTPLSTSSGQVVVPEGAVVHGHVTGLHASSHAGDQAAIRLDFDSLSVNGRSYPFDANVTATNLQTKGDTKNETLKKAGVGAAAGAVLGAVLGSGDLGKIALGGVLGAAAGTAISLGAGDVQAVLPAGTAMTIQSTETVSLR
ncbi:MAG TPA: hypothetical protein VFS44_14290 [Gemmatimonadaceae bacterium]|nr:hypothetical protein [Gemmatimonadaceae bacterium]